MVPDHCFAATNAFIADDNSRDRQCQRLAALVAGPHMQAEQRTKHPQDSTACPCVLCSVSQLFTPPFLMADSISLLRNCPSLPFSVCLPACAATTPIPTLSRGGQRALATPLALCAAPLSPACRRVQPDLPGRVCRRPCHNLSLQKGSTYHRILSAIKAGELLAIFTNLGSCKDNVR